MKEFNYTITDKEGIHMRPAGELVKAAKQFESSILIKKDGKTADCKKVFTIMSLAVKCGQEVTEAVLIIILNTKLLLHLFLRQEYILLNLWTILLMLPRSLIIFIMIQAIFTRSQAVTDITLLCRDAAAHL